MPGGQDGFDAWTMGAKGSVAKSASYCPSGDGPHMHPHGLSGSLNGLNEAVPATMIDN